MKLRLKIIMCFLVAISVSEFAYAESDQAELAAQLQAVTQQMQQMQAQMQSLQTQVGTLKTKLRQSHHAVAKPIAKTPTHAVDANYQTQTTHKSVYVVPVRPVQKPKIISVSQSDHQTEDLFHHSDHYPAFFNNSVIIAPYIGLPTYYNGSDVLVNSPSVNQDVRALIQRDHEMKMYKKENLPVDRPRLVFSGSLETLAQYQDPYHGSYNSDINLSTAQLYVFAEVSPWVSGMLNLAYDDGGLQGTGVSDNRSDNSRVYIDQGYITLGDFLKSPFYGTAGQVNVPFGRYSSSLISSPLTKYVGRSKERALVVGYRPGGNDNGGNHPYAAGFIFHSASDNSNNRINNYGVDLGYQLEFAKVTGDTGISFISTLGDSYGAQNTGYSSDLFQGFAHNGQSLKHAVPGLDLHAVMGFGHLAWIVEYVTAMQSFSHNNLSFNNHAASPSALNNEFTYSFDVLSHPSTFTLNYGMSREALALNIPRTRYAASFQTAVFAHTLFTLEYRHDINYGKHDTAQGQGVNAYVADQLGKSSNTVSAQLGLYF